MELFSWIGQIIEWLGKFIPRFILLDSTEGAVQFKGFFLPRAWRVKCGGFDGEMQVTSLGPGLHFYWPASTAVQNYPTAFQSDNLPSQILETKDGKQIVVGGLLSYEITDLQALLSKTHSGYKATQALTLAAIHDVCCNLDWDQLKLEQRKGTLDTKLRNAAQKPLTPFGVKIISCQLTDLAKTRVLRLIQSTQSDI